MGKGGWRERGAKGKCDVAQGGAARSADGTALVGGDRICDPKSGFTRD